MPDTLRRLTRRFWVAVDNEGVGLFAWTFAAGFIFIGLYGILIAQDKPPLTLRGSMAPIDVRMFYWLHILAPTTSLIGKSARGRFVHPGMMMQLGGDLGVGLFLLDYMVGTFQVESWGKGGYGGFLAAMLFLCALLMITRDVRRLRRVEKTR